MADTGGGTKFSFPVLAEGVISIPFDSFKSKRFDLKEVD